SEGAAVSPAAPSSAPDHHSPEEGGLSPYDRERLRAWGEAGGDLYDHADAPPPDPELVRDAATDAVLAPLATRFRLKAAAARWRADGADPARLPDLRAWFGEVEGLDTYILDEAPTGSPEDWRRMADAYNAAGTAADVL